MYKKTADEKVVSEKAGICEKIGDTRGWQIRGKSTLTYRVHLILDTPELFYLP